MEGSGIAGAECVVLVYRDYGVSTAECLVDVYFVDVNWLVCM